MFIFFTALSPLLLLGKRLSTFLIDNGYATQEDVAAKPTEKDIGKYWDCAGEDFGFVSRC